MTSEFVFINYSDEDNQYAQDIANSLKSVGVKSWVKSINLLNRLEGQDDEDLTEEAIQSSKLFLVLLSSRTLSESVKDEIHEAKSLKKDILILKIKKCRTPLSLKRFKSIDAINSKSIAIDSISKKFDASATHNEQDVVNNLENSENNISPIEPIAEINNEQELPTSTESTSISNSSLEKKESLLVSVDEINDALGIVQTRYRDSKIESGIYVAAALGLIVVVLVNGSFKDMISETKTTVDGALGFLERFYPGLGTILPTAISGNSFKKLKTHKKNIALIHQIKSKRERVKNALGSYSEREIEKLEDDLTKLINL